MKPPLQKPRFGLAWTSLWAVVIGGLLLGVGVISGTEPTLIVIGSLFLLIGILIWQEVSIGLWAGFLAFGVMAVLHATRMLGDFHWRFLVYCLAFAQLSYESFQGLRQLRDAETSGHAYSRSKTPLNADNDDPEKDEPMISLVLLQRKQKYLEDIILAKLVEAAWGGDYSGASGSEAGDPENEESPSGDGFVVGESPLFIIKSPTGMYLVHNMDADYWEHKAEVVEAIGELRLRKAVADHHAWLSVDLLTPGDERPDMNAAYLTVARLLVALADEDTLAVVRPESMDINVWSDEMADRLLTPGAYEELSQQDNAPVIPIADDDPAMQAAVATARHRWPEFVAAFQRSGGSPTVEDDSKFVVKARITEGGSTEFIWVNVIGLEPKYVHGRLANDPIDLGDLELGSQVEFPIADVCDWCYFDNDEPVGLFSLEAIRLSQQADEATN
ncbi:DUF2314 domain-containing protein [Allorhodopirellula heiligendammensis]|uniref:DUF2314 domain-containing protein n=1 Tax=Allorhodopirellula heiligendammensis TaxID=2714739 RepID=A0A5C6C458_9BACT|nr:DUF2314 domain-containing protein [Allorhodopirellula heiligendammensis]TWU18306.1 hypothetical protein Poly21_04680 [Allorhodopirellula heiligendammensis]